MHSSSKANKAKAAHLAIVAMGQQHSQPILAQPLGLPTAHELVKNHLHMYTHIC